MRARLVGKLEVSLVHQCGSLQRLPRLLVSQAGGGELEELAVAGPDAVDEP